MNRFYNTSALTEGTLAAHLNRYLPRINEIEMDVSAIKADTIVFDCVDTRSSPGIIVPADHGMMKSYSLPGGFIRMRGMSENDPIAEGLEILSGAGTIKQIVLMSHGGCPETKPCAATRRLMTERIAKPQRSYYTGLFESTEERALALAFRARNKNFDNEPNGQDLFDLAAVTLFASARNLLGWKFAGGKVQDAVNAGELDIIPMYEEFDQPTQTTRLHVFNQDMQNPAFIKLESDAGFVGRLNSESLDVPKRSGFIDGASGSAIRSFAQRIREGEAVINTGRQ